MKKRILSFLAGMLTIILIGFLAVPVLAFAGMTISVEPINIQVNGNVFQPKDVNGKDVPVFVYNGTTYAPLRALAEAYGLKAGYDADKNLAFTEGRAATIFNATAKHNGVQTTIKIAKINNDNFISTSTLKEAFGIDINANNGIYSTPNAAGIVTTVREDTNGNIIKSMYPLEFSSNNYFLWGYLNVQFNKEIESVNSSAIVIVDLETGNRLNATAQPGNTSKDTLCVIPVPTVNIGHRYSLYIPSGTVKMKDGTTFDEDIRLIFKMSETVVTGTVSGDSKLGEIIKLKDADGNEYTDMIRGDNKFYMTDVPSGRYDVIYDNEVRGTIIVEAEKVNIINVIV